MLDFKEETIPYALTKKTHHPEADVQLSGDPDSSNGDFKLHRLGKNSSEPIMVSVWLMVRSLRWR